MATSYYFHSPSKANGRDEFIGRLEWAGAYCFDCDISLILGTKGGTDVANPLTSKGFWHDKCPKCSRSLNDPMGYQRLEPTDEEIADQAKYLWPVRFATAFFYAIPLRIIKNLQKDTPLTDNYGNLITAEVFRKKVFEKAKFWISFKK